MNPNENDATKGLSEEQLRLNKEFETISVTHRESDDEALKSAWGNSLPLPGQPNDKVRKIIGEYREIAAMLLSFSTYRESSPPRGMYWRKYESIVFTHWADALERHITGEPRKNDQREMFYRNLLK